MSGKTVPFIVIVLTVSLVLAPMFVLNVFAMGCRAPGCQLEAITHVPLADKTVRVQLDGGATFNLNASFTFTNSSVHTIRILDTYFIGASSGKRYAFKEWDYAGSQFDTNPMTTPPMYTNYTVAQCQPGPPALNCPFVAVFTITPPLGCKTNCYLDALTNVPVSDGAVMVRVDGGTTYSLTSNFPYQDFSFANGTIHNIQVLNNTITGTSSGAKYVWKQWTCSCGIASTTSPTLTTPAMYNNYTDPRSTPLNPKGAITALFDKEYPLTLTFTDNATNAVSLPSSVQLVNGGTVLSISSYSNIYVTAQAWTVQNVTWEGVSGIEISPQTVDLTIGAVTKAIPITAYEATIKAVDLGNNPVAGVIVIVTFVNATTTTVTTNSQGIASLGFVPKGTYTAQVSYQGRSVCNCVVNAAKEPTKIVQVSTGAAPGTQTVVSAVVLLAIFGVAAFLLILGIKVRRSPPPPSIQ